jgi:hypothetical protein
MVMEALSLGSLLRVRNNTYGWKGNTDYKLMSGEMVVLCDLETPEVLPGLPTVGVMHGGLGRLTCLAIDLRLIENSGVKTYN